MGIRFGVLIELRLVVQCRVGHSKTAHLISRIRLNVGNAINFCQIASHGSGTATSRHIRHAQRHKNSLGRLCNCRSNCRSRIRSNSGSLRNFDRYGIRLSCTARDGCHDPCGQQHWYKLLHSHSPVETNNTKNGCEPSSFKGLLEKQ